MKIEAWRIEAFGPIVDWDVADLTQDDVVIALGPNESGKSSLFEFLTSAIFGFSPASAQNHPYRPWSGAFPAGTLDVILRDESRAHVARRLTSRPDGRLSINGNERSLGNRSVPWVGLLNRGIFTNVHALTQDEALALDPKAWQAMQDRVLGGSSFDFLRPTRLVVDELKSQRDRYWRPDRRGKPRDREIRTRIRELKKLLSPALERRSCIDDIERRLEDIEEELRDNGAELQRIEVELERDARLAPLLRRVNRMRALDREADVLVPVDGLATNIENHREGLYSQATDLLDRLKELQADVRRCDQARELDEVVIGLLAQREAIHALDREVTLVREDQNRVMRMDRHLERYEGALRELAGRIFVRDQIDERFRDTIASVPIAELRGRHRTWTERDHKAQIEQENWERAEAERSQLERDLGTDDPSSNYETLDQRLQQLYQIQLATATTKQRQNLLKLGAVVGASLILAGIGFLLLENSPIGLALLVFGAVLAIGTCTSLVMHRMAGSQDHFSDSKSDNAPPELEIEIERTQEARDAALRRESIRERYSDAKSAEIEALKHSRAANSAATVAGAQFTELLVDLPVAPVFREKPDHSLIRDFEDIRRTIRTIRDLRDDRAEVLRRIDTWRHEVDKVRGAVMINLPTDSIEAIAAVRQHLEKALDDQRVANDADSELLELNHQLKLKRADLAALQTKLGELDVQLGAHDPAGDPERGLERLMKSRALRDEAQRIRTDLSSEDPGWTERVEEGERLIAAEETIELSDEDRVERRRRAAKLRETERGLVDERGRERNRLAELIQEPGPAHLAGEVQAAEEELDFVLREHDRLAMLERLIRAAEHDYRERYQSPLLASAAKHLDRFTEGRYDLLTVEDSVPSEVRLEVRRRGQEFPEPVATPLSRGTVQQIYFALRLAMVDQVEADEPLPLFLDEMFVNWDPNRMVGGLEVLTHLPEDRQVFLFTADPYWAERAQSHIGARILRMPMLDDRGE